VYLFIKFLDYWSSDLLLDAGAVVTRMSSPFASASWLLCASFQNGFSLSRCGLLAPALPKLFIFTSLEDEAWFWYPWLVWEALRVDRCFRMSTAKAGEQPMMTAMQCQLRPGMRLKQCSEIDLPIDVSSTVQSSIHFGSGIVAFPVPSTPSLMARSVANVMQTNPLPNRMKIPVFWPRGIWRFQVRWNGRIMTVQEHQLMADETFRTK
jgi:hypothetical protein